MILRGGDVVVEVAGGRIESVRTGAGDDPVDIDAPHLVAVPGFIDVQCNGGWGIDLASEPERVWELAAILPRYGVTAFLPTLVSCPEDIVERAAVALTKRPSWFAGAEPLGWHLEGPMLNPRYRGAHDPAMLRGSVGRFGGSGVAMVTLAPELDGALGAVNRLRAQGVIVAAGHTDATAVQMRAAVDAGVTGVTHLFNCMRPLHHREVGPVGVAMTDERIVAGLIADGVHVSPAAVAIAFTTMGSRIALVSDSVALTGTDDSGAVLGTHEIHRDGGEVRDEWGVLAGSVLTMDRAVINLMRFTGCRLLDAVRAATEVPAGLLGLDRGRVLPGAPADLALLTPSGEVVTTIVAGEIVYGYDAWKS